MKYQNYLATGVCGFVIFSPFANGAEQNKPSKGKDAVPEVALTEAGQKLEAKYAEIQQTIKTEIEKQLPAIDPAKVTAWRAAVAAEDVLAKDATTKAKELAKMQSAEAQLKGWEERLKTGPQTLEEARAELVRNKAKGIEDPARDQLLSDPAKFEETRQQEIGKIQASVDKAREDFKKAEVGLPAAIQAAASTKKAHADAMAATWKAMDALGASAMLASSAQDEKLARAIIITQATPRGLAEFAQQDPENAKLIDQLLADKALMIQMLVADGAPSGKYGPAMKIYSAIQKASPKAKEGLFQRLAMAVSLAHAVPILKQAPNNDKEAKAPVVSADTAYDAAFHIDPVKRYLSYEKWYLDGELDPAFKDFSVWELCMVVNGDEPDEIIAWGRDVLRNLRPDCIPTDGNTALYVGVVDKEIAYTSAMVKDDLPELQFMQNILANGGICGRRAFFGRFILRSFGIPTAARRQPGHATLAHWHPTGWQCQLGSSWGLGPRGFYSAMNSGVAAPYDADVNFLSSTQARKDETAFLKVRRSQWIGELVGEGQKPGLITWSGKTTGPAPLKPGEVAKPNFWNDLGLHEQRRIIEEMKSKEAPANTPSVAVTEPRAAGKATVDAKGVITIPSASCSSPTETKRMPFKGGQSDLIVFLNNKDGETLLHYSRYAKETDSFEYTFEAPKAGTYELVAAVVTPKPNQKLNVTANGAAAGEMTMPYTLGMWDKSDALKIPLKAGSNVLKFHGPARVTLDEFTLTPVN